MRGAGDRRKWVRGLTCVLSLGLVVYAISDDPMLGGGPGFGLTQAAILCLGVVLGAAVFLPPAWNARVLALFVSTCLALAAMELAARSLFAARYFPLAELHEKYLHRPVPGAVHEYRRLEINGGDRVVSRINDEGFRGPPLREPAAEKRIIVYGDSFIFAEFSEQEKTFPAQLQMRLVEGGWEDVEVINAGVPSYGTDQVCLRVEDELPRHEPDLIIISVFAGNDYGDMLRNKLFRLGEDGELVASDWTISEPIRRDAQRAKEELVLKRLLRPFGRSDYVPRFPAEAEAGEDPRHTLMRSWLKQSRREYEEFVVARDNVVRSLYVDPYNADISLEPRSESARYKVALMEKVLERIKLHADRHGVEMILLVIPHPVDVCETYDCCLIDRERFPEYDRRNLTRPLEQIADRLGIRCLNLFDPLREVDANEYYFHGGDDHWNDAGQAFAAERMAEIILEASS